MASHAEHDSFFYTLPLSQVTGNGYSLISFRVPLHMCRRVLEDLLNDDSKRLTLCALKRAIIFPLPLASPHSHTHNMDHTHKTHLMSQTFQHPFKLTRPSC